LGADDALAVGADGLDGLTDSLLGLDCGAADDLPEAAGADL